MDDSEPEFPVPTRKELEIIKNYFNVESEFIAAADSFTSPRDILFRNLAVSIIAKLSRSDDPDSFIPYLAINYFNRFKSQHKLNLEDVEGRTETEKVRLIAVSCLTISAKMRTNSFSVDRFLENLYRDMNVRITPPMVMRMELLILQELQWAMRSVTAFCFLNYYYPYFKKICGFKRRSINEIIVQAQGEHTFAHCMPSHIAISAFLAAAKTKYPSKYSEIAKDIKSKIGLQGQVMECVKKMVDLCNRLNIQIESTESGTRSNSSKVTAVPEEEIKEAGTSEEDEDEEWTGLIKQIQDMGKRKARVQVLVQAEELPDDEVRVASVNEVMVADTSDKKDVKETSLAKGKGKAMERSILDIAEVELKWPADDKARIKVRAGQCRRFYSLLCIVLLLMQSCESVTAASSFDFTSLFDYYRLSETWVGTYCKSRPCDKSLVGDRFTIHGLWFDKYPKQCPNEPPSQKNTKNENYRTPADLLEALIDEWPSLTGGKHHVLWEHEWRKHGASVGFRPRTYFKTALELHNQCRVQQALAKEGIKPSGAEISVNRFKEALEKHKLGSTELMCNQRNQLTEIRCCFTRGTKKRMKCPRKSGRRCEGRTLIYPSLGDPKPPRDEL